MAHRIVAGALLRGHRVLLAHRSAGRTDFPDCWSLPGGHVEAGEAPAAALVRELREELGIEAAVRGAPSFRVERAPGSADGMVQDVWFISTWDGEPMNLAEDEHDELRWVSAAELPDLDLAHPEYTTFLTDRLPAQP